MLDHRLHSALWPTKGPDLPEANVVPDSFALFYDLLGMVREHGPDSAGVTRDTSLRHMDENSIDIEHS